MLNTSKTIFFIFWLLIVLSGPIAVFQHTNLASVKSNPIILLSVLQRTAGLVAFSMLFIQILLGKFMPKLTEKFGGWIFNFHIFQGILIYILIIIHPLLLVPMRYLAGRGLDPFYVFTDICILCSNQFELFYSLGRIGFWLVTLAVLAGLFRTSTVWLRNNWRKVHLLNYLAFVLIYIHSFGVGRDIGTFPFSFVHTPAALIIFGVICINITQVFIKFKNKHFKTSKS